MCFSELLYWARQNANIQVLNYVASATWTQVIKPDPLRWSVCLPCNLSGSDIDVAFGDQAPAGACWMPQQAVGPRVLTEDDIGDLIRRGIWLTTAASGTFQIVTISYDPNRKARLDAYVLSDLSRAPTS